VLHKKHNNSVVVPLFGTLRYTLHANACITCVPRMFHVKQFALYHIYAAKVKHKTSFFRVILKVVLLKNPVCCRVHIYVRYGWGVAVAWVAF